MGSTFSQTSFVAGPAGLVDNKGSLALNNVIILLLRSMHYNTQVVIKVQNQST